MKGNRISAAQIRNTATDQELNKQVITDKVKTLIIRNTNNSPQNLYVGFNEKATDKVIVEPGEVIALSKDDGTFYDGNWLTFIFAGSDNDNKG